MLKRQWRDCLLPLQGQFSKDAEKSFDGGGYKAFVPFTRYRFISRHRSRKVVAMPLINLAMTNKKKEAEVAKYMHRQYIKIVNFEHLEFFYF